MLSTGVTVATGNATGFNYDVVLFSPTIRFDQIGLMSNNLLEILTGSNTGLYQVASPGQNVVRIVPSSPANIGFPLDTAAFTYRLSNPLFTDLSASIFQDDLYTFTDAAVNFSAMNFFTEVNSTTPWRVVIATGPQAGTYAVHDILPNNSLVLSGMTTTTNLTNVPYTLTRSDGSSVISSGTGMVAITRRGRVQTQELVNSWGAKAGDWVRYAGANYQIANFRDGSTPYILGYSAGNVAGVTITVYHRLVDNAVGYVDVRGMYMITTPNYESTLAVQNGDHPPSVPVENSSFKENYLVLINGNYYQITRWNANQIDLVGPKVTWGLVGTSVSFSMIQFFNVTPVIENNHLFQQIDRRGVEAIDITQTMSGSPMALRAAALNAVNNGDGINEIVSAEESITWEIQYEDGSIEEGGI